MRIRSNRRREDGGFTLLEVMFAAVVMAIIFMGLISSITGSFLATDMANRTTESQATARRLLEEATEIDYGDLLMLDGSALVTEDGIAAKYQVFETSPGLLTVEVEICRPLEPVSVAQVASMTMDEFHEVEAVEGSRLNFATLSAGVIERADVTFNTEAASALN